MLGRAAQGFVDINAMALNAAIGGLVLADPEACFVARMALPFGSTGVGYLCLLKTPEGRAGVEICVS
jgi:hypothetical protein